MSKRVIISSEPLDEYLVDKILSALPEDNYYMDYKSPFKEIFKELDNNYFSDNGRVTKSDVRRELLAVIKSVLEKVEDVDMISFAEYLAEKRVADSRYNTFIQSTEYHLRQWQEDMGKK